jgi:hypothetical protein
MAKTKKTCKKSTGGKYGKRMETNDLNVEEITNEEIEEINKIKDTNGKLEAFENLLDAKYGEPLEDVDYYCIVGYFCDNVTGELEKHDVFFDGSQYYFNCVPRWKAGTHKKLVIPEEKVCRYKDCPYIQYDEAPYLLYRFFHVGTFKLTGAIVYEYTPVEYDNDAKKQPREFIYDFERPKDFKYFFMSGDFSSDRIFIWFDKDKNSAEDLIDFDAKPRDLDDDEEEEEECDTVNQYTPVPPTQSVVLRNKVVYDALTKAYRRFIDEYGDNCETSEEFYGRNPNSVSPDDYFTYLERQVERIKLAEEAMHKIVELLFPLFFSYILHYK